MPNLLKETHHALLSLGIVPRKRFGQNFMIDDHALAAVANALEIKPGDRVMEIGPGLGFLSRHLSKAGATLTLVEKDRILAARLAQLFNQDVRILEKDILLVNPDTESAGQGALKVIGNIPYNITSPILEWIIIHRRVISRAVLTVQWEVAQRLQAAPGGKEWGVLSAYVQFYAQVKMVKKIPKAHFFPIPKVDSAILAITPHEKPLYEVDEERLFKMIRISFQKRRKTLLNSLKDLFPRELLQSVFIKGSIDPMRRPETLTLKEWVFLASNLS